VHRKVVEIRTWRNVRVRRTHPTGSANHQGDNDLIIATLPNLSDTSLDEAIEHIAEVTA
jgi:hypothetical protein